MLEDSDEDEGDLCRICQMGEDSPGNPLIQPCHCTGSLQFVHQECIKKWLRSKISSGTSSPPSCIALNQCCQSTALLTALTQTNINGILFFLSRD